MNDHQFTADVDWAFDRYEAVRPRLPSAQFPRAAKRIDTLLDIADDFDAFFLDAFGVLNVGATAVPGAVDTIATLAARAKALFVLTNGATSPRTMAVAKYRGLGYAFEDEQVISSRDLLARAMATHPAVGCWGFAAPAHADIGALASNACSLNRDPDAYERAEGLVLLSTNTWTDALQERLVESLHARPRPLLVGNPDLVAPHEHALSIEPGQVAHEVADRTGIVPEFYGKPFANAFEEALERLATHLGHAPDRARVAMVGDTLHTDILGGAAAGVRTVLVESHGLFRGRELSPYIERSGIVPDFRSVST